MSHVALKSSPSPATQHRSHHHIGHCSSPAVVLEHTKLAFGLPIEEYVEVQKEKEREKKRSKREATISTRD
jgi:hypothetical protein